MADEKEGRTETSAFAVPLSPNNAPPVESSEPEAEETEATELEAETETSETSAESAEDENPEPPTMEEMGYDPDSPRDQAAYKVLMSKHAQWTNKFLAKHKQKPETQPEKPAEQPAQAAPAASEDPISAIYKVDFETFKPNLTLKQESDLGEYRDEIVDLATQVARQMIEHTLGGIESKDRTLRERMSVEQQQQSAVEAVRPWVEAIAEHPEWGADKEAEIRSFAEATQPLLLKDPKRWIKAAEAAVGLSSGWRGDAEARKTEQVRESARTATKLRANVPRPTTGTRLNGAPRGDARFDDAFEAEWKKAHR